MLGKLPEKLKVKSISADITNMDFNAALLFTELSRYICKYRLHNPLIAGPQTPRVVIREERQDYYPFSQIQGVRKDKEACI